MAFQTLVGADAVDYIPSGEGTAFIGTENKDLLITVNVEGEKYIEAKEGDDDISLNDYTGFIGSTTLKAGDGDDVITIGENNENTFVARLHDSSVNAGAGEDTITVNGTLNSTVRGNEGADVFNVSGNYTSSVINGNSGEDNFFVAANAQNNADLALEDSKIVGGSDNDIITVDGVLNTVNSTINGNVGNDRILLGLTAPNNWIEDSTTTVFGGQGDDYIQNDYDADIVLSGDKGDDEIWGDIGDETILGGEGNDIINAGDGDNLIEGGAGNDFIEDGDDDSTIFGGEGNDTIDGFGGFDVITPGLGADNVLIFTGEDSEVVFESISDSPAAVTGTTSTFDYIEGDLSEAGDTFTINFDAAANQLAGGIANTVVDRGFWSYGDAVLDSDDIVTFDDLKADAFNFLIGNSDLADGTIGAYTIEIDEMIDANGDTYSDQITETGTRTFLILADTNDILTSADMMFEVDDTAEAANLIIAFQDALA